MIVTARIADRQAFISGYGAAAAALVERFGGRYILRAPGAELLEGANMRRPRSSGKALPTARCC
jgi:uncharacterized protein (DUF1330 family)